MLFKVTLFINQLSQYFIKSNPLLLLTILTLNLKALIEIELINHSFE